MDELKHLQAAPFDARRFGINVFRSTVDADVDPAEVINELDRSAADLLILRVPAGATALPTRLQLEGHVAIHADTLVYYATDLSPDTAPPAEPKVERAAEHHREMIAAIAEHGFSNYRAHYAANPLIPSDLVLTGYVEWALSRLSADIGTSATWVVRDGDTVAGFATCDVDNDKVEIILNAVHPDFERRGLYGMLLRHIQHYYAHNAVKQLLISTQIWNFTVQRQWARNGLRLVKAYDTYHIDRRLRPGAAR